MHDSLKQAAPGKALDQKNRLIQYASVFGLCMSAAIPAMADPSPALDRVSISAGVFRAEPTFSVGVETPYGNLNTPDRTNSDVSIPRLRADILLFDSQGISFDYYRYDRSYAQTVSGSSTLNGQPVTGNATFNSNLKLDLARLSYKWWIGSGNSVFGIGLGGAYYRADLTGSINGTATVGSTVYTDGTSDRYTDDAVAPLIELGWRHAFTPNVRMYVEAGGVKKNSGNLQGHIYNGNIGVEWFPWKNIGLVLDYGEQRVKLERSRANATAEMDVRFRGPSLFVKARF
ncbi:autotransporter outer membrane beta-barrel domain-containing protein [uncultured Oxalicibacterium sp.]|uniref:autotransporter outer membrane beta-barrel domain-containing protein n=1 Tax=uncultured Oxalicibacterium sp. TaxID=1168540 RepID=UPI0025FF945D|nr:autotransporter outer membrane beta-barrel domain-containing protein [uncultured Oxalicibacterium sp.]